jgi:hypothetical protein
MREAGWISAFASLFGVLYGYYRNLDGQTCRKINVGGGLIDISCCWCLFRNAAICRCFCETYLSVISLTKNELDIAKVQSGDVKV